MNDTREIIIIKLKSFNRVILGQKSNYRKRKLLDKDFTGMEINEFI